MKRFTMRTTFLVFIMLVSVSCASNNLTLQSPLVKSLISYGMEEQMAVCLNTHIKKSLNNRDYHKVTVAVKAFDKTQNFKTQLMKYNKDNLFGIGAVVLANFVSCQFNKAR